MVEAFGGEVLYSDPHNFHTKCGPESANIQPVEFAYD